MNCGSGGASWGPAAPPPGARGGRAGAGAAAGGGEGVVDERAKRAILLAFKLLPMAQSQVGDFRYHDRVPLKTRLDGVRVVPGEIGRASCRERCRTRWAPYR